MEIIDKPTKWDEYFMNMVYFVASLSKDESSHLGAVVVDDDHIILATGYNSFPRGIIDTNVNRQLRPEKYFWMEHAERNAIYSAARNGVSLKGCTMYTQGIPCMDCARGIRQAGISTVIVDLNWDAGRKNGEIWKDHSKRTVSLFAEGTEGVVMLKGFNLDRPLTTITSLQRGTPLDVDNR